MSRMHSAFLQISTFTAMYWLFRGISACIYFRHFPTDKLDRLLTPIFCCCSPIQYGYHVSRIPYADYRVNELTPIFHGMNENTSALKSRVLRKRYGVKIEFHQAGMLGRYIIHNAVLIINYVLQDLSFSAKIGSIHPYPISRHYHVNYIYISNITLALGSTSIRPI